MNPPVDRRDELTEAALLRVGQILKRKWRLDSLLGVGGTAAVYAATHRNGNRVAIKVLHAHVSLDHAITSRLQQEGYAANLVEHPGAVRILDDDRADDGSVFLVMELLYGEGLDLRLRRKGWRLPETEVVGIGFCLLDVLAAAHDKGVIHRDVKPDNVFLTREGHIKVLDFGIARLLEVPEGLHRSRSSAVFGTLGFMAPEQALGRANEIDPCTDVWAVGATLFTLLTGRLVHEGVSPNEQLVKAATMHAPPLLSVFPEGNPHLAAIVDRALAFDRAQRWQSARHMQEALRALAESATDFAAQPVLQGPRLSVELDIPASGTFRSWRTPLPARSTEQPAAYQPTEVVQRRPRAFKTMAAVALACALAAGALAQRALTAAPAHTEVAQVALPLAEATPDEASTGEATPGEASPPGNPPSAAAQVTPPMPPVIEPLPTPAAIPVALAATTLATVSDGGERVTARAERRRPPRRFTRGGRRGLPAVSDDDALWGRRY